MFVFSSDIVFPFIYIIIYDEFLASSEAPSAVYHGCRGAQTRQHQDDDKRALHAGPPRIYALSCIVNREINVLHKVFSKRYINI
ncbi:hypothetical protein QTP88_012204 [Uroleucon formosanum]